MQTIIVPSGNLFQLAAQYLGDATQWNRIAELNGFTDPMIYGLTTLIIPAQNSKAGGGIATQ